MLRRPAGGGRGGGVSVIPCLVRATMHNTRKKILRLYTPICAKNITVWHAAGQCAALCHACALPFRSAYDHSRKVPFYCQLFAKQTFREEFKSLKTLILRHSWVFPYRKPLLIPRFCTFSRNSGADFLQKRAVCIRHDVRRNLLLIRRLVACRVPHEIRSLHITRDSL